MIDRSSIRLVVRSSLLLALVLALWSPVQARSAEPAPGQNMTKGKMPEHCQQMVEERQKMRDARRAEDAKLREQLVKMNKASDGEKVDLMAAVVTQMVEHRISRNEHREEMHKGRMHRMHMGKAGMSKCPMMDGMQDDDAADARPGPRMKGK
jgi:hypothetical protein